MQEDRAHDSAEWQRLCKRLAGCSSNAALIDLQNESCLRRQCAHDIARVLGAMNRDGLDVDPEALALRSVTSMMRCQLGELRAAVSAHTAKRRTIRRFRRRSSSTADTVRHRVAAADEVCAQETAHRTQRRRDEPVLSTENGLEGSVALGVLLCSS